jgi:hypothetical protein
VLASELRARRSSQALYEKRGNKKPWRLSLGGATFWNVAGIMERDMCVQSLYSQAAGYHDQSEEIEKL